jgi:hypothetical protein
VPQNCPCRRVVLGEGQLVEGSVPVRVPWRNPSCTGAIFLAGGPLRRMSALGSKPALESPPWSVRWAPTTEVAPAWRRISLSNGESRRAHSRYIGPCSANRSAPVVRRRLDWTRHYGEIGHVVLSVKEKYELSGVEVRPHVPSTIVFPVDCAVSNVMLLLVT